MSTPPNANETLQQRRERLLRAQAARQRALEEEVARQEVEFAAEMERVEEEEKKLEEQRIAEEQRRKEEERIAEERRLAEERRMEEEERRKEEEKVAEEKRIAEEERKRQVQQRYEERRLSEARKKEEEARNAENAAADAEEEQAQTIAFARLVEENKKEKERAAEDLKKRRETIPAPRRVNVEIPVPTPSPRRKTFKSKAIISDESDNEVVEQPREVVPRGTKRKRTIKMIAKSGPDVESDDNEAPHPPDISEPRSACSRCVIIGRPSDCRPQSTRRPSQACEVCHLQKQRCSWSGDNAARRSRGKRVKLNEEVYEGPAARAGERRFEGPGIAEQLAAIVGQNKDLIAIARRSLDVQERIMYLLARREKRELKVLGENVGRSEDEDEDEDEDGEGEEDEEEKEKNDEKRKSEIREGKKRTE
ncbi:hypothetical protein F5890DRAFT_1601283 [Lentinula detonsa]|uniref:Uncharacterized protein n=1 Tax=Lentinula detonsa TaxID=2804962 RepID=A0AA38PNA1_9AGAR|nr:hypothetical protein F5890DRAFT_1601283 [Lentinula detonsa]